MAAKKGGRRRRIRVIVVTAAIVVVAVAGYFAYRTSHSTASAAIKYTTVAAQKMTLTSSVSGTGNIVLGSSATVSPSVSGTVSGLAVKAGDKVTKGQILFTLVNDQLDLAVQNAQNSYNQAVNSLSQAKLSVLQAKKNLSDLKTQKAAQTASAAAVASATRVASAADVATAAAAAGALQPASALAAVPVEPSSATSEAALLTAADSSAATATSTDSATGSTSSSSTTTESTSTSTPPSTTSTTQTPTTQATQTTQTPTTQATGTNTSTTTKTITTLDIEVAAQQVTTAELGVTSAQTQIESAKLALQQAEDTAAERDVTAPIDGTVTTLNISDGDTLGSTSSASSSAGAATSSSAASSSSSSAMVITDLSSFEATVTLAEADVASVKVAQRATMTFDALPDLTLTGKVESVDNAGTVSQGVVSYTVTITPDVANESVKGGMTVTADIITNVTSDALVVPSTAVKSDSSGGNYVQILTNGSPVNQTVVVGTSNDTYTQITSGLTVGQKVVTATTSSSAKTTGTTTRSNGSSLLNGSGLTGSGGVPTGGGSAPSGAPPAGN